MDFLKLIEDWRGYSALSEIRRPESYEQRLKETIDLLSNAIGMPTHRQEYLIREALTTSDFPLLFADVLDRQVLASYKAVDPVWKKFTRPGTVNRLAPHVGGKRFAIHGGNAVLPLVAEKGEYLARDKEEVKYDVYAYKRGAQFDISWETLLADDLGALKDTPEVFAWAAINTEHWLVTNTYAGDNGTHALGQLYGNVAGGEVATDVNLGDLTLTIRNLEATLAAMHAFRDRSRTIPIKNRARYLVVPPALEFTARQILTSANKMWVAQATAPAGVAVPYPMTNVVAQYGLELVIDPWLPIINANDHGDYAWYLFAEPRDVACIEVDHLRGHERPEICMKASDKVTIGGGPIGPMDGDFATDNILYRVRLCVGANRLDWRATYQQDPGTVSP